MTEPSFVLKPDSKVMSSPVTFKLISKNLSEYTNVCGNMERYIIHIYYCIYKYTLGSMQNKDILKMP